MNPILLVVCYHNGDVTQAEKLLDWISELDGKLPHSCLLVADREVPIEKQRELKQKGLGIFHHVEALNVNTAGNKGHLAANMMFHFTSEKIQNEYRLPFLWMEPDCVPMEPGWLNRISEAYHSSPKRYLGDIVVNPAPDPKSPLPPKFLSGISVYPSDAHRDISPHLKDGTAWDMAAANKLVPMALDTPLIQHFKALVPPVFKEFKSSGDPENVVTRDFIQEGAVLFHADKSGTLLELLRPAHEARKKLAEELAEIDREAVRVAKVAAMKRNQALAPPELKPEVASV